MKLRAVISNLTKKFKDTSFTVTTDCNPEDLESLQGKELDIEIKAHRKHRSLQANAKLWASLSELAAVMHFTTWDMYLAELKAYGTKFTQISIVPEALEDFKKEWRAVDVVDTEEVTRTVQDPLTGYPIEKTETRLIVNCYYGSHTYNTLEFSRLLNGVIQDMDAAGIPSYEMRKLLQELKDAEQDKNV